MEHDGTGWVSMIGKEILVVILSIMADCQEPVPTKLLQALTKLTLFGVGQILFHTSSLH
ncbi:hypothetical protein D3C80_2109260 [compost metagenome]